MMLWYENNSMAYDGGGRRDSCCMCACVRAGRALSKLMRYVFQSAASGGYGGKQYMKTTITNVIRRYL